MSQTMSLLFMRLCGNLGPQKLNFDVSPKEVLNTLKALASGLKKAREKEKKVDMIAILLRIVYKLKIKF